MRAHPRSLAIVLALSMSACSYDWGSVPRFGSGADGGMDGGSTPGTDAGTTPRPDGGCLPLDPETTCPVGAECFGEVEPDGDLVELQCRSSGGSSYSGRICEDASFCNPGLLCWQDPTGEFHGHCYALCLSISDCPFGTHCDATGTLRASYFGRTAYPCIPD